MNSDSSGSIGFRSGPVDHGRPSGRPPVEVPITHRGAQRLGSTGKPEIASSLIQGGPGKVFHHLENSFVHAQSQAPKTHRDGQPQAQITQDNTFRRFPTIDLDLENTFLGLPVVIVKSLITKALEEKLSPQYLYQFLALYFGKFTPEEYTAVCLAQISLLSQYQDDIIDMCQNPNFPARIDEVALFIATKTGLFIVVDPDPKKTIRLIENALKVGQKILNDVPKDSNPLTDENNIKTKFASVFSLKNVMFSDHFKRMREMVFDEYEMSHNVVIVNKQGESGQMVVIAEPSDKIGWRNETPAARKEFLAQLLVAYKNNAPADAGDDYMSASAFGKYIRDNYSEEMRNEILQDEVTHFIRSAIDECLLEPFIPMCDDTKDNDEKIIQAEFLAYQFNVVRDDKKESKTAGVFRDYLLKNHPNLQAYKIDRWIQRAIDEDLLLPYEPKYEANANNNQILREEVMAYKLNQSPNVVLSQNEIDAMKAHFKRQIADINRQQTAPGPMTDEDVDAFFASYARSQSQPYKPKHTNLTSMQKILQEEYDAYVFNKPVDAPANYGTRDVFKNYLKEARNIFEVKGMRADGRYPENINEEDIDNFVINSQYTARTPLEGRKPLDLSLSQT